MGTLFHNREMRDLRQRNRLLRVKRELCVRRLPSPKARANELAPLLTRDNNTAQQARAFHLPLHLTMLPALFLLSNCS